MTIVDKTELFATHRPGLTKTRMAEWILDAHAKSRCHMKYRSFIAALAALALTSCAQVQGHNVGAKDYFLEVEQGPLPHKGGTYGEASEALASHVPDYCPAGWRRIAEHTRVDDTGQTWLSWVVRCD